MDFKKSEAYQSILMVLRALASNDERIIDYFRAKTKKGRNGTPVEIEVDEKIAELIDTKEFTKTIELNVWSRLAKLSWMPFEEAREIVRAQKFKNVQEYWHWENKPLDIPRHPHSVVAKQPKIDTLGGGKIERKFYVAFCFKYSFGNGFKR